MRVLFLDVDGVLNNRATFEAFGPSNPFTAADDPHFCPKAVRLVQKLVFDHDFYIAISSTWRLSHGNSDFAWWLAIPERRMLDPTPFIATNEHPDVTRGEEIARWLVDHGPLQCEYVILDDLDQTNFASDQLEHLFMTDGDLGFTEVEYERILSYVNTATIDTR